MRRNISLILALVLALTLVLAGCGGSAAPAAPAAPTGNDPAPASPAEQPAASAEVIELKLHHHDPTTATVAIAIDEWAKRVEARCDGKLKITIYPAATLGAATDAYDMVKDGVADIAWGFTGFFPGVFPITDGLSLPLFGITSATAGTNIIMDMYNNTDILDKEYAGTHVLWLHGLSAAPIATNKVKLNTIDDFKGLTIRCGAGTASDLLTEIGANPVTMASSELYTSLEKGVLDGYSLDWTGIDAWSLLEQTEYLCDCKYTLSACWLLMNEDTWNSLPADIQEAFNAECTQEAIATNVAGFWDQVTEETIAAAGDRVYDLTDETRAAVKAASQGIVDNFISDLNGRGYDGQAIYDKYVELIGKYA